MNNRKRRTRVRGRAGITLFAVVAVMLVSMVVRALYSIDCYDVSGGGGTSTGGVYAVSGTIGQPDAGTMRGGQFTLQGGFWPGIMVPSTGEAPTLFIQLSGDSVVISWSPATAGFGLEATTDLAGAVWSTAPAGNPVTTPITGPAKFYRLRKP